MEIIKDPLDMQRRSLQARLAGKRIGFVPTMGALHEGHLSLLDIAAKGSDIVVMSIFVNPTQFGPAEDFSKYPRPFNDDCALAGGRGCDIVFAPSAEAMYPKGYQTFVHVEEITRPLCGASRPGHFRGVSTVVMKFLNIVQPDIAVFGQKDAQQAIVIRRMVDDLNVPVGIVVAPIVREPDGLAMSSRNRFLTPDERLGVAAISAGIEAARKLYETGERSTTVLRDIVEKKYCQSNVFNIEYIELVDTVRLEPKEAVEGPMLLAVACRTKQSNTRLIDNVVLGGTL
jgi:pantoate--beta-alanine ligase